MAVRQVRTCDVQGKKGLCEKDAVVVTFGYGVGSYEIDLCDEHRGAFTATLAPYRDAARTTGKTPAKKKPKATGVDNAAVRQWLATQKIEVPAKGRISGKYIEQYRAAHGLAAA